jgi:hypothetical protein
MVLTCEVVGNITGRRLIEVLQKALPSMKICESPVEVGAKNPSRNELYVRELDSRTSAELVAGGDSEIQRLKEELRQIRESLADLENAMVSTNQKYEALKKKFGSLNEKSTYMLWNHCVPSPYTEHAAGEGIPARDYRFKCSQQGLRAVGRRVFLFVFENELDVF